MSLFQRTPRAKPVTPPIPDDMTPLRWCYEVSEDGGESWHPEIPGDIDRTNILRRGTWSESAPL